MRWNTGCWCPLCGICYVEPFLYQQIEQIFGPSGKYNLLNPLNLLTKKGWCN
jgi:hypothetical protein